ncbi:MAG TPA: hypothetical protein VJN18_12865 [Polyangiaceae bacterium]|nr:hypothetical protein [Polyangiaceae bacterium]
MRQVPKPSIYLCNRFIIRGSCTPEFLTGMQQLLASTLGQMRLIAGFGERRLGPNLNLAEPALNMTQVWELSGWSTLYEVMWELSEAKWYRELGDSGLDENQQLLVNFTSGYGIAERTPWQSDTSPGYRYLYEELSLKRSATMQAHLRELSWLAAQLSRSGFARIWCARHITGRPGQICMLWQVPDSVDIEDTLARVASNPRTGPRYAAMMQGLRELKREVLFPIYTERQDERIRSGETAPLARPGTTPPLQPTEGARNTDHTQHWQ